MITTLISLQTHLNAAYPGSLINTLQGRPLCPFFLSGAPWWGSSSYQLPNTANDRASLLTAALKIEVVLIFRNTILFFGLWMVSSHSGGRRKEPWGMCVCVWLTAVNHMSVRWESSFREASHRWKARRRRPSIPTLSLFLIHCFSVSPCLVSILRTFSSDSRE